MANKAGRRRHSLFGQDGAAAQHIRPHRRSRSFCRNTWRAMALTTLMLELSGPDASLYQFSVEALFLGAPVMRVSGERVVVSGPTGREPLVGLRVALQEANNQNDRVVQSGQAPQSKQKDQPQRQPSRRLRPPQRRARRVPPAAFGFSAAARKKSLQHEMKTSLPSAETAAAPSGKHDCVPLDWSGGMQHDRTIFDEPHHQSLELLAVQALAAGDTTTAFAYADRRCRIAPPPGPQNYTLRAEALFQMGEARAADCRSRGRARTRAARYCRKSPNAGLGKRAATGVRPHLI